LIRCCHFYDPAFEKNGRGFQFIEGDEGAKADLRECAKADFIKYNEKASVDLLNMA